MQRENYLKIIYLGLYIFQIFVVATFACVLVIFGYQSINWLWTFNLWILNFYSWEGKKWV